MGENTEDFVVPWRSFSASLDRHFIPCMGMRAVRPWRHSGCCRCGNATALGPWRCRLVAISNWQITDKQLRSMLTVVMLTGYTKQGGSSTTPQHSGIYAKLLHWAPLHAEFWT